jgi:hypothetical protein
MREDYFSARSVPKQCGSTVWAASNLRKVFLQSLSHDQLGNLARLLLKPGKTGFKSANTIEIV